MHEQLFSVSGTQHRLLGKQVKLQFADDFVLKLTPAEASSLSFALVAVRDWHQSGTRDIHESNRQRCGLRRNGAGQRYEHCRA